MLAFDARAPRFEGTLSVSAPAAKDAAASVPWRVASRVKADYAAARLDQIDVSYGSEARALKLTGNGEFRFGASPLLRATLSARQLDADRMLSAADGKDNTAAAEPGRALPALRALIATAPPLALPAQIEFSSEQIMLGGRPLQDIATELHTDGRSWRVHRLEFRAPGGTRVSLSDAVAQTASPDSFKAALNIESADPDVLMVWLQGRGDLPQRSQKPLRLRGDVTVSPDGFAVEAMRAEIDGGAVEGRLALSHPPNGGAKIDAEIKAERLDLDAATAFVRSLAGPQAEWPREAQLSLDIGRAVSSGQELRPLVARLGYGPDTISLERLKVGQPDNVTLEGVGRFDRASTTGKLTLNSSAASIGQLTALIAPFAPTVAARLTAAGLGPGAARLKLALDLDRNSTQADRAIARGVVDLDGPQMKGSATILAKPPVDALRRIDLDALSHSELGIEAKLSAEQGRLLVALLGLDGVVAAGNGPLQFEGSANGAGRAPLGLKAKMWGAGLDVDADGSIEPWAADAKAGLNLRVRSADLGPLLDLKPSDPFAGNIRLSSRVTVAGSKLTFDDLDSIVAGSRLRGHLALTLGGEKNIEGRIGLDQVMLAPIFALAIGASGRDAAEPIGSGLTRGWRGRVAFQALRGTLPGGSELQPVSGILKADGQSLTFDAISGKIGGGELTASVDARQGANGIALNASAQLNGADASMLRYRNLVMPKGRATIQMALMSQGRSASALAGALSGSGTVTLEAAKIAGLDPRVFEIAIRASDNGQAIDDARLKQLVEPALSAGALSVASAQIPFNVRDGRLRVGATTLAANGVSAIVAGGYDIPADQADIRATLALTAAGSTTSRPEIQLFSTGTPDALSRTIDVTPLSSWLAVRTIDRETRRLDAIERGEPAPPPLPLPALPPPDPQEAPDAVASTPPLTDVPIPGRDPRRQPQKPKISAPRPAPLPPVANAPAASPPPSVTGQPQVAPLPPAIDVRPAPGAIARPRPPRPPLALTPQVANPPPRPALQNSN